MAMCIYSSLYILGMGDHHHLGVVVIKKFWKSLTKPMQLALC